MGRPRKVIQPDTEQLLEPPAKQMSQLNMVSDLLMQRQNELSKTQHDLTLTRAAIQSERIKWDQDRRREKAQLGIEKDRLQEDYDKQLAILEGRLRQAEAALQRADAYESEKRQSLLSLREREEAVATLAKERFDVAKLRQDAEAQMALANQRLSAAQTDQNDANAKLSQAQVILKACEERNHLMNEEWNKLTKWQEDLNLRQHDYELLKQEVDRQVAELSKTATVVQPQEEVNA